MLLNTWDSGECTHAYQSYSYKFKIKNKNQKAKKYPKPMLTINLVLQLDTGQEIGMAFSSPREVQKL